MLKSKSKYKNRRTEYNGHRYDSAFEASCAAELDIILKAGEISAWDRQYKCEMQSYDANGKPALKVNHRVDFRVHHWDETYTLLEAKGAMTKDWKMRVDWLKAFWLPIHLDHEYVVWHYGKRMPPIHKIKGKSL